MMEMWRTVVPAVTELLLLAMCLLVWRRLRLLGVNGVCQWTLAVIGLDAMSQAGRLWVELGQAAGVTWLLHTAVSYTVVYVLLRLGELVGEVRRNCDCRARS